MTTEELKYGNYMYLPILVDDVTDLAPLMQFVPTVDEDGQIMMYRRTEYGWNMRDGIAPNTPPDKKIVSWLKKMPIFEEEQANSLIGILESGHDKIESI